MAETATLTYKDTTIELPVIEGTEQEKGLDISKLRTSTGLVTLDPGFKNTGATTSEITFLDGEKGVLRYRGYPIEQLAENTSFTEVSYLLLYGDLPNEEELNSFDRKLSMHTLVHEDIKNFFLAYPSKSHPMGQLISIVSALSTFYPDSLDPNRSAEKVDLTMIRLLAKFPTIVSWIFKKNVGHPIVYPQNNLDFVSNFMHMTFGQRTEDVEIDPVIVDAVNKLLILHADHEQNCSTSTVKIVGSSHANLYASVSAGISALWGPLHGGANQAVLEMLENIRLDGGNTTKWLDKAKDKSDPFRLMGFGHRVYKNFDPRATIIKKAADSVLEKLGVNDPLLEIGKKLEEAALNDDYFKSRKLFPNVDFYSGIIYKAIDFPVDMFTVMFALGRLPGWIAQWKEMLELKSPIGRPRQIYTGHNERTFVALDKR